MNFVDKIFGRLGNRLFQMAYIYSQFRDGVIPDYYLQDYKFFEKYGKELKAFFGEGVGYEDKIGVHFRRGDYVNNPFYVDLTTTDYYKKAMALFPNDKFLLFSDDHNWLSKNFEGEEVEFAIGNEEEDLKRMASCKHQIIANSSFSWWAAYLNPNPDKKVIYPSKWYTDGVQRTKCPKEWLCM